METYVKVQSTRQNTAQLPSLTLGYRRKPSRVPARTVYLLIVRSVSLQSQNTRNSLLVGKVLNSQFQAGTHSPVAHRKMRPKLEGKKATTEFSETPQSVSQFHLFPHAHAFTTKASKST